MLPNQQHQTRINSIDTGMISESIYINKTKATRLVLLQGNESYGNEHIRIDYLMKPTFNPEMRHKTNILTKSTNKESIHNYRQ